MAFRHTHLECARCHEQHPSDQLLNRCDCGGTLLARYDPVGSDLAEMRRRPPGLWRYRELLPVEGDPVSLGEGATPLLPLPRLSERWGVESFLKDDGPLPSGTFKARGAAVGLTRARELGATALVMPSAGNAGGAWSLYAARAGMPITVTMAATAPAMNQTEVRVAGGTLVLVEGTLADASRRAREISADTGAYLSATFNEPFRLEGKKTAWLETFDTLGTETAMRFPGTIITSVGGGVAAVAASKAADEVHAAGWTDDDPPVIIGVQPSDCAPIVRAFEAGDDQVTPWDGIPTTIAAGLRVTAPSEGDLVLQVVRASGGRMMAVDEAAIHRAITDLATTEGIFACPEGATTVAAVDRLAAEGPLRGPLVLYNTGAGAKYLSLLTE